MILQRQLLGIKVDTMTMAEAHTHADALDALAAVHKAEAARLGRNAATWRAAMLELFELVAA